MRNSTRSIDRIATAIVAVALPFPVWIRPRARMA